MIKETLQQPGRPSAPLSAPPRHPHLLESHTSPARVGHFPKIPKVVTDISTYTYSLRDLYRSLRAWLLASSRPPVSNSSCHTGVQVFRQKNNKNNRSEGKKLKDHDPNPDPDPDPNIHTHHLLTISPRESSPLPILPSFSLAAYGERGAAGV